MFTWFSDLRRNRLLSEPFPEAWNRLIGDELPHDACLDDDEKQLLRQHVRIFVAEKQWEGAGGFELTDEHKVIIAAQACLLLLGLPNHNFYPNVRTIIVYPSGYWSKEARREGLLVHEGVSGRLGEAWQTGQVILSWADAQKGAYRHHDGHNVVLHEFAHLLDMRDGYADGVPLLHEGQAQYDEWASVMEPEFESLRANVAEGRVDVLDGYGATNPAEFFAVATECFFELPLELQEHRPQLYEVLRRYYKQDTALRAARCRLIAPLMLFPDLPPVRRRRLLTDEINS